MREAAEIAESSGAAILSGFPGTSGLTKGEKQD